MNVRFLSFNQKSFPTVPFLMHTVEKLLFFYFIEKEKRLFEVAPPSYIRAIFSEFLKDTREIRL